MSQLTMPKRTQFGDEGKIIQTRYWINIGGYGITPEMLELTGFWNVETMGKLNDIGANKRQTIEQIFGGALKFKPLPGKRFEERLDKIIDGLNKILQVKRHIQDLIDWIPQILSEQWHKDDLGKIPGDLPEEIKKMIDSSKKSYVISSDPMTTRQILQLLPELEGLKNRIGYYPSLYREANTLFQRMVLESVSMSLNNLAIKDQRGPEYIELEDVADVAAETIMES